MAASAPQQLHPLAPPRPELIDYTPQAMAYGIAARVEVTISAVCEYVAFGANAAHLFVALARSIRSLSAPSNLGRTLVVDDATGREVTFSVVVTRHKESGHPERICVGFPRELTTLCGAGKQDK